MKFLPLFLLLSVPVFASEITSPFYVPQLGHVLTKTSADYEKGKRTMKPTTRTYRRSVNEEITIGLGAGMAGVISGDMNWTRQKGITSISAPHTKGYGAGLKGSWEVESFLTQISALYHQTTNVDFEPRRLMKADLYLGKKLNVMTPYLHLAGDFPLHVRPEWNEPRYRGETGVFQPVNKNLTLDTALFLDYDKNIKGRSYGIRTSLDWLMTSWASLGINGEWQPTGHAKAHTKTYRQKVGTHLQLSF